MSLRYYQKNIIKILEENTNTVVMIEKDRGVGVTYVLKEYVKKVGLNKPNINILYVGTNMVESLNFIDSSFIQFDRRNVFRFNNGTRLFLTTYNNILNYIRGRLFDLIILDNIETIPINESFSSLMELIWPKYRNLIITFNQPPNNDEEFLRMLRNAEQDFITYMYVSQSLINNI